MAGAAFAPISTAPPWDWNPIGVGIAAFNDTRRTALAQQAEARLQEAQGIENEVRRMTLPYAGQKAMLEVENLRADITQRQASAQSALALAEYRRSLAQGEMTSSLDSLASQHPGLSYLLGGSEVDDEVTPARAARPLSNDSLRLAPPMLDSSEPISLDEVNASGLPSASAKDNVLLREYAENRRPNVFDDFAIDTSKIPPEGMLADSSSGLTPTAMSAMKAAGGAMDAPASSFEQEGILQSARATLNQKQNPLLNLPIMSQDQPQPAERSESLVSELQRYVQTDKQVQADYLRNRASMPKKERGLYDGQMSAQLKQLPIIVNQKFGLSDSAYNRVRDWSPESFSRFETLRSEAQGSFSPDEIVDLVNRENAERMAETYKRGKGAPAAVDLDEVKKRADLFDVQVAQETDPLKQGALKRAKAEYITSSTGAQVTGRQYVQEYLNQRAAAPDDGARTTLDTKLLVGLPQDDTARSFNAIAEMARTLKDQKKEISFMRDTLRSARDKGTFIVRPTSQGISVLSPEQLTDEAIESMIAPPAPPAASNPDSAARPSADAPILEQVLFDVNQEARATEDARNQKEKTMQAARSSSEAAQEKRSQEIKEFDALYDQLVSRGNLPAQRELGGIFGVETTGRNPKISPEVFNKAAARMEQIIAQMPPKDRWRASSQSRLDRVLALRPN